MKNYKKIIIFITVIILIMIVIAFFYLNTYNNSKTVNNIDKSNIKEYILNISSYEARVTITVNSNKNINKYILKQQYNKDNKIFKQEVIEPGNIAGLKIIYDGTNLKIENSSLNLSQIYENYQYITDNALDLSTFIQKYNNCSDQEYEETDEEVILILKNKDENRYNVFQTLYINKETALPTKMEIIDKNQNIIVYIEYIEIRFNSTSKEDILAFSLEEIKTNL